MKRTAEQEKLREQMVIALIEATFPLQQQGGDPEVALELLIEAAGQLEDHLRKVLEELREESD